MAAIIQICSLQDQIAISSVLRLPWVATVSSRNWKRVLEINIILFRVCVWEFCYVGGTPPETVLFLR